MFQTHYNVLIVFNKLNVILYNISDQDTQPANLLYELWLAAGLQLRWLMGSGPFDQHSVDIFKLVFFYENCFIKNQILLYFGSYGSNYQNASIGSDNGVAPNRRQAIILSNEALSFTHIIVTRLQCFKWHAIWVQWSVTACATSTCWTRSFTGTIS